MIESLSGKLILKLPHKAIVEWNGLAIELLTSLSTFRVLGMPGENLSLLCHLHWREEGPQLFAFATEEERSLFRLLMRVNKVGPKLAINILSAAAPQNLALMILQEDVRGLTALKGVGPKLASRLVTELKENIAKLGIISEDAEAQASTASTSQSLLCERDARDALENLGYNPKEIDRALRDVSEVLPPNADLSTVIETILKSFV